MDSELSICRLSWEPHALSPYGHVALGAVPVKVFVQNVFKNVFNWIKESIVEYLIISCIFSPHNRRDTCPLLRIAGNGTKHLLLREKRA